MVVISPEAHSIDAALEFLRKTDSFSRASDDLSIQGYIVLTGTLSFHEAPQRFMKSIEKHLDKPVISLGMSIPNFPSVVPNNRSGMRAIVDHMTRDPQRRNIVFIQGGRTMPNSIERETVFREVLAEKQIPVQEDLIIEGRFQTGDAYAQMLNLLARRPDIHTVVAASDRMAYSAIQALRQHGLQVPDDVIVSGFDNGDYSIICEPPLTSASFDIAERARTTVHALLTQINGGDASTVIAASLESDTQMVIRRSSVPSEIDADNSSPAVTTIPGLRQSQYIVPNSNQDFNDLPPPPKPQDQEQAEIAESLQKALAGEDNTFIEQLSRFLYNTVPQANELRWCEQLIIHFEFVVAGCSANTCKKSLLPCLHKAHEVIAKATGHYRQTVAFENERIRVLQDNLHIRLASCTDFSDLHSPLRQFLNAMPLHRMYIILNDYFGVQKTNSQAKLLSFHKLQDDSISEHILNEAIFDVDKGLPSEMGRELRASPLVLLPLCDGDKTFGSLVVGHTYSAALSLENLATSISCAVNNCLRLHTLASQARELQKNNASLSYLAERDELTGLRNRSGFCQQLQRSIERLTSSEHMIEILYIDLDGFKTVNDSFGHDIGDNVLKSMAKRLTGELNENDICARFGGDEFAVILEGNHGKQSAAMLADRILSVLKVPFSVGNMSVRLGASIGISRYGNGSNESNTVVNLLKQADTAMYYAKSSGKNNTRLYADSMEVALRKRMKLENAINVGLENGDFYVKYQPRVNIINGEVIGFEVLMRWNCTFDDIHPDDTLPGVFIPVAEATGAIVAIDQLALTSACKQLKYWKDTFQVSKCLSVNMSVMRLQQSGLVDSVQDTLNTFGVDPKMIELEITESSAMNDIEDSERTLKRLRSIGVHLSIDDFGTGHSSLAYLKKLPVDCLKIDQSFLKGVTGADFDNFDAKIVKSIIGMGNSMGFSVVAEGVETQSQSCFLLNNGCKLAQGNFYSTALSAEAATVLCKESCSVASVSENVQHT